MLGGELGRWRELDRLRVPQRALGEGGEPADGLDLVAEELDPRGPILRGAEDIEDAAPHRKLPPLLHLVDPLIASLHQPAGHLAEVDLLADAEAESRGPERRLRHRLGQSHRARDHDRRRRISALPRATARAERVERRDSQSDEVRRRRDVR
jgi:hypothetical protein